jgi:hypothetical protein
LARGGERSREQLQKRAAVGHGGIYTTDRAESTTTSEGGLAIRGRDSAYSGKAITWPDLLALTACLGPTRYTLGPVPLKAEAPVPGVDQGPPLTTTV